MKLPGLDLAFDTLPAPLPIARARATRDEWSAAAQSIAAAGGRLVALWGSDRRWRNAGAGDRTDAFAVCAAYALRDGLAWIELGLDDASPGYPDLAGVFRFANRMQRAIADTLGIACDNA